MTAVAPRPPRVRPAPPGRASRAARRLVREPVTLAVTLFIAAVLIVFVLWPTVNVFLRPDAEHWSRFLGSARMWDVARNTAVMTLLSTVSATALGFLFAYALSRPDIPGKPFFRIMSVLPLVSPPFVIGLSLILLFGRRGLVTYELLGLNLDVYGLPGLWAVQTMAYYPVAVLVLTGVLRRQSPALEWAGRDLGHGWWGIFRTVTLPLAVPGLASAGLLVGMYVLADFGNPLLVAGSYRVLAVEAYHQVVGTFDLGMAAVLCVALLVPTGLFFWLQRAWLERRSYVTVTGKESTLDPVPTPAPVRGTLFGLLCVVSGFMLLTYASVFAGALTKTWGVNWTLTLQHFEYTLLRAGDLTNSTLYAVVAGFACAVFAVLAAFFIQRRPLVGRGAMDMLAVLPGALPGTMIGIAWLITFHTGPLAITGTALIVVLMMTVRTLPVGYRSGVSALQQIGPSLDESAQDLGSGSLRTFRTVMLPLMRTAFTAAFIYAFVKSINTLSAVIFLVSPGSQLASVSIMGLAEHGYWGEATALAAGLMLVTFAALALFRLLTGGRVKLFEL
ncbi:ABC transporter permease [Bailinhaonella thermotolerans]|uniref:Iron ABC transporter permease n=1 Tax=Bailinhaonella thermotolerans TaxID=1070861 RepID=A0A3A4BD08_9ACTN|nr:iron ABC transporter permease [Bailinhaonella thermotolerans]RJL35986.1 iron ABC transporter permease [Bailinhaonella thermotolerans]